MLESGTRVSMSVQDEAAGRMGHRRQCLLAAIRKHGSISAAAREIEMSYKAAWDAVHAMNNLFGVALIEASAGGRGGGGANLTPAGERVLAAFGVVDEGLGRWLERLEHQLTAVERDAGAGANPSLVWSLLMKSSARNLLRCEVREVRDGAVNAEVLLDLPGGQTLCASITRRSVADLGLVPGQGAFALIKASFVIVVPGNDVPSTSARNQLKGRVASREDGAVNSELVIDIGGAMTITAIITLESARNLDLQPGDPACALFKASHVILAV